MDDQELFELTNKILDGEATLEETGRFVRWFDHFQQREDTVIVDEELKEALLLARIQMKMKSKGRSGGHLSVPLSKWVAAAAVFIVVCGLGAFIYRQYTRPPSRQVVSAQRAVLPEQIRPGQDQAVLFLANGQQIDLNHTSTASLKARSGAAIADVDSGQLVYEQATDASQQQVPQYNRLVTPKAGQYRLTLPDGTRAWLNAASSIRYPTAFAGVERHVEITGEVYFEVRHMATRPFIVTAGDVQVKVLGTHFDVNAYMDDGLIRTTLLEGAVDVQTGQENKILKPGQQASTSQATGPITVSSVDAAEVISWTRGLLHLNTGDIRAFMSQLSRWYNIEVVYLGQVPHCNLEGIISRSTPLSDVITVLQASGIQATFKQGRLMIASGTGAKAQ